MDFPKQKKFLRNSGISKGNQYFRSKIMDFPKLSIKIQKNAGFPSKMAKILSGFSMLS